MPTPLTPEALVYGVRQAGDPQVSPDGTTILYTLTTTDAATRKDSRHLWVCDIDGGNARQITFRGESNGDGRWSPDGTAIAFVSDRPGAGDDKGSALCVLPFVAGGEAREVTRHRSGLGSPAWSPDGTRIAYLADWDPQNPDDAEPPEDAAPKVRVTRRIDYKRDGDGWLGDRRPHVFVVDIATGQRRRLTSDLMDHDAPAWSPDGSWIVTARVDWTRGSSQLMLLPVDGGEPVLVGAPEGQAGQYVWSPTGDRLLFAGSERWTAQPDLYMYELVSGELHRLTDDLDVLPLGRTVWLDDRQVLLHAARAGASGLYVFDSQSGAREQAAAWQALHDGLSVDRAGRYVVQSRSTLDSYGELAVHDLQSGETRVITSYSKRLLREMAPPTWERLEVRRGEFTIEGWLFKPPGFDPNRRYPVVLSVHGGPEGFYGHSFHPLQQLLATNDFLVLAVNPRGSTSYGRAFTDVVLGDWGIEPLADLLAVLDMVLENPWADGERVGITGGSYGGYMTAWAIGRTRRFAAAVAVAVTFDLEAQYLGADMDHAYGDYAWGGPPWRNRAWYDEQSPSSYVHTVTTPTLILHGEEDHRCPIGQAEEMFGALIKAGCVAEFARYPGGSHAFSRNGPPEHRVDFLRRSLAWFKEYLGEPRVQ